MTNSKSSPLSPIVVVERGATIVASGTALVLLPPCPAAALVVNVLGAVLNAGSLTFQVDEVDPIDGVTKVTGGATVTGAAIVATATSQILSLGPLRTGAVLVKCTVAGAGFSAANVNVSMVPNAASVVQTNGAQKTQVVDAAGSPVAGETGAAAPAGAVLVGGQYNKTTPNNTTDGALVPIQTGKRGIVYVNASLSYSRQIALPGIGPWTGFASLPEGACDCVSVDSDASVLYGQMVERAPLIAQAHASWTAGTGWVYNAGTKAFDHTPGNTAALSLDTASSNAADPLIALEYYAVVFTITNRTAGTVTPKLGTTAGTARSTSATYIEIISAQSAVISLVPDTNFDGSIPVDHATTTNNIWAFPRSQIMDHGVDTGRRYIKIVAAAANATPGTMSTAIRVEAGWYRVAAHVEQV